MKTRDSLLAFGLACLVALGFAARGPAQEKPATPPPVSTPSDLAHLEVGRAYFVRFAEGMHPFRLTESGLAPQPNGPPGTWRINYQVDVFVVRKLGGGSWVLMEHPEDPKEATDILGARNLLADKDRVAEIEADPKRREFLEGRRKAATGELKMTQTWINLAHALTIGDPPPPDQKVKIRVNVEAK